jgi:pimeloyl-ACP methyl ester carboxylesterase
VVEVIHVFHGFLGSPLDFDFLKQDNVILHDLCELKHFPEITKEDILIGYSMGGRIALEIAASVNYDLKKIVLINAHPGLQNDESRGERKKFEDQILKKLKELSAQDFLEYWNALPLFSHDEPIKELSSARYDKFYDLFQEYRLSNQVNHLPIIIRNKHKIIWFIGQDDEKYINLTEELLLPHDLEIKAIPGGHRLFQRSIELREALEAEGIL